MPQGRTHDPLLDTFGSDESDADEWVDDRSSVARTDEGVSQQPNRWTGLLSRLRGYAPSTSGPQSNDGVFHNLVAVKDEDSEVEPPSSSPPPVEDDDITPEVAPPSYAEASADATPSYWETTILANDLGEEIIVGELPVGTFLHFAWNMLLSTAFSYFGFFFTYLFHTSHAARGGSVSGFGVTLIQSSYSLVSEERVAPGPPADMFAPSDPNNYQDGAAIGYVMHPTGQVPVQATSPTEHNNWLGNCVFILGVFLLIKGTFDFLWARSVETAIITQSLQQPEEQEQEQEAV